MKRGKRSSSRTGASAGTRSVARARATGSRNRVVGEDEARRLLADSSKLYYRIGEVSELTGVKAHVLRYWETEFRWMAPPKSRSKQRLYRKRDIEFVWLLKRLLWDQRYTIAGARQRIQDLGLHEALARNGDSESLDAVLFAGDGPFAVSGVAVAAESGAMQASPESASLLDRLGADGAASLGASVRSHRQDYAGVDGSDFPVALEAMRDRLLALREALAQGL